MAKMSAWYVLQFWHWAMQIAILKKNLRSLKVAQIYKQWPRD